MTMYKAEFVHVSALYSLRPLFRNSTYSALMSNELTPNSVARRVHASRLFWQWCISTKACACAYVRQKDQARLPSQRPTCASTPPDLPTGQACDQARHHTHLEQLQNNAPSFEQALSGGLSWLLRSRCALGMGRRLSLRFRGRGRSKLG
jgi:hypothetical protein